MNFKKLIFSILTIGLSLNGYSFNVNSENKFGITEKNNSDETVEYPASMISGTLPVVYIDTKNNAPVVTKDHYVDATFYMVASETADFNNEAIGSAENPVSLTIKGRGNSSWEKEKKPYKLKFDKKVSIFGLPKSKHYALMAYYGFHGYWACNLLGFELGRFLDMGWQPSFYPVELVLNGEYEGVYFLAETIKIDSGRLNIFEQEDEESDPNIVPYGWLLEIDNSQDEYQIRFEEYEGQEIWITHKSPEILSSYQRDWLVEEMTNLTRSIYNAPKDNPEWSEKISVESLVKYFIIRELMHDYDSYSGSMYLYKDKEEFAKWEMGPIWDCTIEGIMKDSYMPYDPNRPEWASCHWMKPLMTYPIFNECFQMIWNDFYTSDNMEKIFSYLEDYSKNLQPAFDANNLRWHDGYPSGASSKLDVKKSLEYVETIITRNGKWIEDNKDLEKYVEEVSSSNESDIIIGDNSNYELDKCYDVLGRVVSKNAKGLQIRNGKKVIIK